MNGFCIQGFWTTQMSTFPHPNTFEIFWRSIGRGTLVPGLHRSLCDNATHGSSSSYDTHHWATTKKITCSTDNIVWWSRVKGSISTSYYCLVFMLAFFTGSDRIQIDHKEMQKDFLLRIGRHSSHRLRNSTSSRGIRFLRCNLTKKSEMYSGRHRILLVE